MVFLNYLMLERCSSLIASFSSGFKQVSDACPEVSNSTKLRSRASRTELLTICDIVSLTRSYDQHNPRVHSLGMVHVSSIDVLNQTFSSPLRVDSL